MTELQKHIEEYFSQLCKGSIQKAYRGIMLFMSALKTHLQAKYPDYFTGNIYFGFMDMTYFPFTPPLLKDKNLKIAIVFLHELGRFDIWLSGNNRKVQAYFIKKLSQKDIGQYQLSKPSPGVDSIIESNLVLKPDFDDPERLKNQIEMRSIEFIRDITKVLEA